MSSRCAKYNKYIHNYHIEREEYRQIDKQLQEVAIQYKIELVVTEKLDYWLERYLNPIIRLKWKIIENEGGGVTRGRRWRIGWW